MKTMNNFAAQQLTKMQMNEVKGGLLACLLMDRNNVAQTIYVVEKDEYLAKEQATNAGGALYCKEL